MAFDIVIVGSGIAGLAAAIALANKGHRITILEATSQLRPIGGAIVLQANANRVLKDLGVYEELLPYCNPTQHGPSTRAYRDGRFLAIVPSDAHEREYGLPSWPVHRADLQRVMVEAVKLRGVHFKLGCPVAAVDESTEPMAVLAKSGNVFHADVLVGADGIDSVVRDIIFPQTTCVHDSGMDVTRASIPARTINANPETAELMEHVSLWCGPSTTVATMAVRNGDQQVLTLDCCHRRSENAWKGDSKPQDLQQLQDYYKDYCPSIRNVLSHVKAAHVWKLRESRPPSWVSPKGRIVLIGDAAHASRPWVGQGGGMALEDGSSLAECLERAHTPSDIPALLKLFECIRRPRCEKVQEWSAVKGERAFLHAGPELAARDTNFRLANAWVKADPWDKSPIDPVPELGSPDWKAWLSGHHAVDYTKRRLDAHFQTRQ